MDGMTFCDGVGVGEERLDGREGRFADGLDGVGDQVGGIAVFEVREEERDGVGGGGAEDAEAVHCEMVRGH